MLFCDLTLSGYSSGSAGGSVWPDVSDATNSMRPTPSPSPRDEDAPAQRADLSAKDPSQKFVEMETSMVERLEKRMAELENTFMADLAEKKRKAEEELEQHVNEKRQRYEHELQALRHDNEEAQAALALAHDQLTQCKDDFALESKALDELRLKGRQMQDSLDKEAAEANAQPATPKPSFDAKSAKELLRHKLEQTKQRGEQGTTSKQDSPQDQQPPQGPRDTQTEQAPPLKEQQIVLASDQRFTSATHPQAWQCLYRMCKKTDGVDKEIYEKWHAGGSLKLACINV